jgi:hypothetical protein
MFEHAGSGLSVLVNVSSENLGVGPNLDPHQGEGDTGLLQSPAEALLRSALGFHLTTLNPGNGAVGNAAGFL